MTTINHPLLFPLLGNQRKTGSFNQHLDSLSFPIAPASLESKSMSATCSGLVSRCSSGNTSPGCLTLQVFDLGASLVKALSVKFEPEPGQPDMKSACLNHGLRLQLSSWESSAHQRFRSPMLYTGGGSLSRYGLTALKVRSSGVQSFNH